VTEPARDMKPPNDRLARAPTGTTASGLLRSWHRDLPRDLLTQASRRLSAICLLGATLWIVSTILFHYVDRVLGAGDLRWLSWQPTDWLVALGAGISLALYVYVRRSRSDPQFLLDLGLVYMVANGLIAGMLTHWDPLLGNRSLAPTLSWLGITVLLFAAMLPNHPWKTLVAGALTVSMNPAGMLIARARGVWSFDHAGMAWMMHYPDFLVLIVAVIIARVVFGLGRQVAKAREMGSYQLGQLLGKGGMGEVYRATHRMLARPAAIKLIRPEVLGRAHGEDAGRAAGRFRREAEVAASLRSPHTVELYDFGETEDGTLYFAMELLDGLDLETLVRETGPLPASRVVRILRQVCDSLEEAHARGLVHRDIKPANIHLGRLGLLHDYVKVLDFGLVTAATGQLTDMPLSTVVGVVRGTPAYMAPEMATGEPLDGRSDLYSLGCVAYFLLTGRLAFEGETALQMLMRRLQEDPLPPSQRTELPIPVALDAVVLACLARKRDDRPAGAADLRRRLNALDVPPWTDDQAAQWWAQHRPVAPPTDPFTPGPVTALVTRGIDE